VVSPMDTVQMEPWLPHGIHMGSVLRPNVPSGYIGDGPGGSRRGPITGLVSW
jgi:hypothetical protein